MVMSLAVTVTALAQEVKKIDGDVGWVTLDKKAMTLVREGKHLADLALVSETVFKILEEQKADAGKSDDGKKKDKADPGAKEEPAPEVKKDGGSGVATICYTIKPGSVNDVLSGWKASVSYVEQGKKKVAKEILLTPVAFGGDEEE